MDNDNINMKQVETFDRYLDNKMADEERRLFEEQLANDKRLRDDLERHKLIVAAVQQAGTDNDARFEDALRQATRDDMEQVVAAERTANKANVAQVPVRWWQRASTGWLAAAACLVLAATMGFKLMNTSQNVGQTGGGTTEIVAPSGDGYERGDSRDEQEYGRALKMIDAGDYAGAIDILEKLHTGEILVVNEEMRPRYDATLVEAYILNQDYDKAHALLDTLAKP